MAIALQAGTPVTNSGTASPSTISVTVNAGVDRILVVCVVNDVATTTVSSVTFGGVALQRIDFVADTAFAHTEIWYLINPAVSTANVVTTMSGTVNGLVTGAYVLTGVNQNIPFRTPVKSNGASATAASDTVANVSATDFIIDSLSIDNTGNVGAVGADQTQQWNIEPAATTTTALSSTQSGANGGVMSWTWGTLRPFAHIAVAFVMPDSTARPETVLAMPMALDGPWYGSSIASATAAWTPGTWNNIICGWFYDTAIIGITFQTPAAPSVTTTFETLFELGMGPVASEVTEVQLPATFRNVTSVGYLGLQQETIWLPEAWLLPAGKRLAIRAADSHTAALTYSSVKVFFRELYTSPARVRMIVKPQAVHRASRW